MKSLTWFKSVDCSEINIIKYKSISDENIISSITIKEVSAIKEIINRIQKIPVDGDKMKSFGPKTKKTKIIFSCPGKDSQQIEIYDQKIKTPTTGFLTPTPVEETELVRDIEALVAPELNTKMPKIKDLPIKFKGFSVTFSGTIETPQPANGPTIGPTNKNFYNIVEEGSANQVQLSIFDGQIPAQPQAFVVGKKIYYLLTYQSLSNETLYPKYFEISDKKPKN